MAKTKSGGSKSGLASKMKVQAGPSGKMHKFGAVKPQKPGQSAQQSGGGGGYAKK
jgi:hypothetical protein